MIELLLVGAVGLAVVGLMLDDDDQPVEDLPADPEDGIELAFDGSTALVGTDGNDILPLGQDPTLAPDTIDLLGGDDIATLEQPFGMTLDGGAGNDTLSSIGVANTLIGGAGDDTLYGVAAVNFEGGSGNDTIIFDSDVELNGLSQINGGPGDDVIEIIADAGIDNPDRAGAIVLGGEGGDAFDIVLELQASQIVLDGTDEVLETGIAAIRDFDPDLDTLSIEIEPDEENTERRIMDVVFEQSEVDSQFVTEIEIIFEATDTAFQAVSRLSITSQNAFALSDVNFINARFV